MCGRYASFRSDEDLRDKFAIDEIVDTTPPPSWNVAPTDPVRIVVVRPPHGGSTNDGGPRTQLRTVSWGLVPSWTKPPAGKPASKVGGNLINGRAETITEKPAFRRAATLRRAVIPMDGYFEWQTHEDGRTKTPYYLTGANEEPLAAAGLYELWRDPTKADDDAHRWLWTCAVITTTATDSTGHIHDRSPLLLPDDFIDTWLDPSLTDADQVRDLVASVPEPHLVPRVVSPAVGNVRNNGPQLIEPVVT
ncbi:SOS response-associated peptidase [Xylanimonas protaetiae]|uniref:Abasic site processing protein n=1 Tax=Xylanimonas protaetiae TaxID=2509457 RepID=A0A4P6F423_9MICO|nr:SOS response-associated peptidase [Xylanimonas protaetiae]QAY70372.1 SOS response-associated peptidase [Xylanimonas protaetiae]